jgi:hypothetical protein
MGIDFVGKWPKSRFHFVETMRDEADFSGKRLEKALLSAKLARC